MLRLSFISFCCFVASALLLCSCQHEPVKPVDNGSGAQVNESLYQKGFVRIKVSEELAGVLEENTEGGEVKSIGVKSSDDVLAALGASGIKRTFPYAGKFEKRAREWGMHRWYDVTFDPENTVTKAKSDLSGIEGVEMVDLMPKVIAPKYTKAPAGMAASKAASQSAIDIFDDPSRSLQWHYDNSGTSSVAGGVADCDINVVSTWQNYVKGSPEIVVAVIDGGVQYDHPDLAANMWVNEAELNGSSGRDDDGNGYVDDIYGFNFYTGRGTITPAEHGTHVAGTVAAVNNNGIGLCGVAGGDYAAGQQGARIMSCQIFSSDGKSGVDAASAFYYAANNGAIIAQNSWGYEELAETPQSDKDAIDYFIATAGTDEEGNQDGPMKGGIVIFAAGNEDRNYGAPASYDKVIAVTALAADYKRAYYSNYGTWADIAAPGGDANKGQYVWSTVINNRYDGLQGTSMACPHVSGIAALIIEKFGGPGFTADQLRDLMELACVPDEMYKYNSDYKDQLGIGLIDVTRAMSMGSTIAPEQVTGLAEVSVSANNVTLSWTVPSDEDDTKPSYYNVYYSKQQFDKDIDRKNLPEGISSKNFAAGSENVGETMSVELAFDEFSTTYYVAVDATDMARNLSELSDIITVTTADNNLPEITPVSETDMTIENYQQAQLEFSVIDPDGHTMTYSVEPSSQAVTVGRGDGSSVIVTVNGPSLDPGTHEFTFKAKDAFGGESSCGFSIEVKPNNSPVSSGQIEDMMLSRGGQNTTVDLNEFFKDPDGEKLTYMTSMEPNGIVRLVIDDNGIMTITPEAAGMTEITVTAVDFAEENASIKFKVLVSGSSTADVEIYPNPVIDYLNFRSMTDRTIDVRIYNDGGNLVYEEKGMQASSFVPGRIDMSDFNPGVYVLLVEYEGKEIRQNIVKL